MAARYAAEGGVGVITLDRPPANSYDASFVSALGNAVEQAAAGTAPVVILRSANEKFFSAGADVKAFSEHSADENMAMVRAAHAVLNSLARLPQLFVAEIAGHALGGGLEIALACDLRFAAQGSYRIGLPEATLGLLPGTGGTQRLTRLVGPARALDLMITGRTLSPQEAHDLGIVDHLMAADRLSEATREYAEGVAGGAPKAIANIKAAVYQGLDVPLEEGLAVERELVDELFRSDDGREGITAFLEKRPPRFQGS